jgi:hypothetical protein
MRRLWWLVLVMGCSSKEATPIVPVERAEVPAAVLKAAREKMPDVEFTKIWKTPQGTYDLSGRTKRGKIHQLEISPEGKIVEVD